MPEASEHPHRRFARDDPRRRCAGEQPQEHQRRHPEAPPDGLHRGERLGQVLPRVRHDRERVAAPDQRDVPHVRAAVHGAAEPPRGRRARERQPRDHRRPGAHGRQLPLDGRHRHRRAGHAPHPLQQTRAAPRRLAAGVLVQHPLGVGRRGRHVREGRQEGQGAPLVRDHRRHVPAVRGSRRGQRRRPRRTLRQLEVARRRRSHDPRVQRRRLDGARLHRVGLHGSEQADQGLHRAGACRTSSTRSRRRSRSRTST